MAVTFPSDLDIARKARLLPMADIAARMGIGPHLLEPYGHDVAKIKLDAIAELADRPRAKYVVVSAITPTPLGEGKTTTTVGLGDALGHIGKRATVAIRQPSMGPTFGIKGGAAGGGYSQVVPMERLNLHLTGDFHAVTAAHNLLAAMIDNYIHHSLRDFPIDLHSITWRRVLDVSDRVLRSVVVGLGAPEDGVTRQTGFDITAASEVMAVLALSTSLQDMRKRLGRIVIGLARDGKPITADFLHAGGAMTVIMLDAIKPNLLQTIENTPVLVHAGPVWKHRERSVVGPGRSDRHPRRRLPGHGGGLRRGHGCGAVLQHQVQDLRPGSRRRGHRGHRAGPEGSLRQVPGRRRTGRCRPSS